MTKCMFGFLFGLFSLLAACDDVNVSSSGEGGEAGAAGGPGMGGSAGAPMNVGGSAGSVNDGGAGGSPQDCPPDVQIPAETLVVSFDAASPATQLVVAGQSYWTVFAQYMVQNVSGADQRIVHGDILLTGDGNAADVDQVALAMDGSVRLAGSQVVDDGAEHILLDEENAPGLVIPAGTTKTVQLWAKLAPVLSSTMANGEWFGVPRSGHAPALSLTKYRLLDEPSCVARSVSAELPSPMVIRKSRPFVTQHPIAGALANGDRELLKFQVAADNAGPIALKHLHFFFGSSAGVQLDSFKLRRNAMDAEAAIKVSLSNNGGTVFVDLDGEDVISPGSGNVYTLHAIVNGVTSGSSVTTLLWNSPEAEYLGESFMGSLLLLPEDTYGFNKTEHGALTFEKHSSTFLWSDLSEDPHSSVEGGSIDWINDALIPINFSQELVAL